MTDMTGRVELTSVRYVGAPSWPSAVAFAGEHVWVTWRSNDGGGKAMVTPLDPRSGSVAGTPLEIAGTPGWTVGGGGMVADGDSLWIVGGGEKEGAGGTTWLTHVDAARQQVLGSYDLGGKNSSDVAVDPQGGVWVLMSEGKPAHSVVKRFDPEAEQVIATIPIESQWARRILSVDGGIVVQEDGVNHQCLFTRIDPATDQVATTRSLKGCWFLATDGTELWGKYSDELRQLDPSTGQQIGPSIPLGVWEAGPFNVADGRLWVAGKADHLLVVDAQLGEVVASANGPKGSGIAVAVAGDRAWGIHYRRGVSTYRLVSR